MTVIPTLSKTLADAVYQRLRADIVSGTLRPGSKLHLGQLKARYQVGMSPLREALMRLSSDALVVSEGQRGFWVAPLSMAELNDISRVRGLVEVEALQLSIQRGGPAWEDAVRAAFHELEKAEEQFRQGGGELVPQWDACNRRFHEALISACDSPWLMRMQHMLYTQAERYRAVSLVTSYGRPVHDEHVALYEAVLARHTLKAARLLQLHLENTASAVSASLHHAGRFSDAESSDAPRPGRRAPVRAA